MPGPPVVRRLTGMNMAELNKSFLPGDFNWIAADQINGFWEFVKVIDWTEPWLVSLIIFHVLVLLSAVLTRKYTNFQAVFFIILLILGFLTEKLNELGAKHWRVFSREQYFDSNGLFILVVFAGPLLFNCFVITAMWTWNAAHMLIIVKRGELKENMKQQGKEKDKKE